MGIFNTSHDDGGAGSSAGTFKLKAGVAIAQNDGVQLGPDGQAWPVKVTDYAAVANVGSTVVAATSIIATYSWPYGKNPIYRDPATGNLFFVTPNATGGNPGYGCRVTKYSPAGILLGSVVLSGSGTEQLFSPKIRLLANGNLLVTWNPNASADYRFAIVDKSLNIIKAATSIDAPLDQFNDVLALSGGGFMVTYRKAGGLQRIAVYDNAGNVVTASATVQTWIGTANVVPSRLVQLSNGNVALLCTSSYTTTIGAYFGIFTAAGAAVLAMASIDPLATNNTGQPEAVAVNGYFAFAYANSANNTVVLRVYSNAGALQGAALSTVVSASGASNNCFKLLTDGTQFFLLLQHATSSWWSLIKMPVAGAGSTTYAAGTFTNAGGQLVIDAFIENGRLVAVHSQSSTTPSAGFFVMNLVSFTVETPTTGLGWDGLCTAIVASDDFTFTAFYDTIASPGNYFRVVKYANTAIMGVALAAAATGGLVNVGDAGAYVTNQLNGTASKQFDHSAANIYGNKGALLSNGAVLRGF